MSITSPEILLITDHEFWQVDRGSRQRISELVQFLASNYSLSVFCITPSALNPIKSKAIEEAYSLKVFSSIPQIQSKSNDFSFFYKVVNLLKLIIAKIGLRSIVAFLRVYKPSLKADQDHTIRFVNVSTKSLHSALKSSDSSVVIIEYLRLHSLLPSIRECLPSAVVLLDSHDVLSFRGDSFARYGYSHWCKISSQQEAALMMQYDSVMAASNRDYNLIASMIGSNKTILAGHPASQVLDRCISQDALTKTMSNSNRRILFLASGGEANKDTLEILLRRVLPSLNALASCPYELLIAGSICLESFTKELLLESGHFPVKALGVVDSLFSLYSSVDIVSNPVRFGGGIKIKNIEALAAGCALVTTTEGSCGLPVENPPCFYSTDDPCQHAHFLADLLSDPDRLSTMQRRAIDASHKCLSPAVVYKDLKDYVDSIEE